MTDKTKRFFADEVGSCAEDFTKAIVDELRNSIENIKKYYKLSDEELCELLGVHENYLNDMCNHEDADCDIDLRTIGILTLLSNGRLSVLTDTPNGEMFNKINRIIKDYKDEKEPKDESNEIVDKISEVLKMFGVNTETDLDNLLKAVKDVRGIINKYDDKTDNKCCKCNKTEAKENGKTSKRIHIDSEPTESEPIYVDEKGNFHSQKPYKAEDCKTNEDNKVSGYVYNSKTMDKPEIFNFKGSLDKIIPTFYEMISRIL